MRFKPVVFRNEETENNSNRKKKHQWKQWIDATTQGFKDKLKEEGEIGVAIIRLWRSAKKSYK